MKGDSQVTSPGPGTGHIWAETKGWAGTLNWLRGESGGTFSGWGQFVQKP